MQHAALAAALGQFDRDLAEVEAFADEHRDDHPDEVARIDAQIADLRDQRASVPLLLVVGS